MSSLRPVTSNKTPFYKKLLLIIALFVSGAVLFSVTAFYIFPLNIIEDRLKEGLKEKGFILSEESLRRGLFFSVEAEKVELSDAASGRPLLHLDSVRARPDIQGLFTGRLKFSFAARVDKGDITGDLSIGLKGALLSAVGRDMEFKNVPALMFAGLNMGGAFNGVLSVSMDRGGCPSGYIKLKGAGLKGDNIKFMGFPLPLGDIDDAGLTAELKDCMLRLEGLWVEGRDLSARLHGDVILSSPFGSSPVNMTLEVTPKGDLLKKDFLLSFISAYRKSANYYSIPVRGTVGSPAAGP